ncbi:MAG: D-glycero-beta-D-manno-heptose 1-phosphate adenylyltransferase [Chloroflexi bacterium]|nr:D-glycero-beta-D-manno-heptose 1-phosphate adenylyltransferase [Chloroflexota bacterium]
MELPAKLFGLSDLGQLRASLRTEGKRVVLTNGCFDILHVGHVRYLRQARALGDFLVVGLNSDDSARALKGPARPLVPEAERAEVLGALECVDAVVIFSEKTAEHLVEMLRPDVYVKGGDYGTGDLPGKELPEAKVVDSYGGTVRIVPFVEGRSTTDLVNIILEKLGRR